MAEDPRLKNMEWFDAYDVPANITKDDDATQASYILQFENPQYPIKRLFFNPKNHDGIYNFGTCDSHAIRDWRQYTYAYEENQPVELWAVTKHGINGEALRWKMEHELRRIAETYPIGAAYYVRNITRMTPRELPQTGAWKIYAVRYNLLYNRPSYDYTSGCSITYGHGHLYDFNITTADLQNAAIWTTDAGGSTGTRVINPYDVAVLTVTVFVGDYSIVNTVAIGISTNLYTKIYFRYMTAGTATAKIVVKFNDATTQTVLAESSASEWTVGSATLTPGKTLNQIYFYSCDDTGTVYYDYALVCTGEFTFPNVVRLDKRYPPQNAVLPVWGRGGGITQKGGTSLAVYNLECDLDMQQYHAVDNPTGASWKRAGDDTAGEVFKEIWHRGGGASGGLVAEPWQLFTSDEEQHKVFLSAPAEFLSGGGERTLRLELTELRVSSGYEEYYNERLGTH